MKLLTKELCSKLPKIGETSNQADPLVIVKYFAPWSQWTWYGYEYDQEDEFFGLVVGQDTELGYFYLSELESVTGPGGLKIERDMYFKPCPLSAMNRGY